MPMTKETFVLGCTRLGMTHDEIGAAWGRTVRYCKGVKQTYDWRKEWMDEIQAEADDMDRKIQSVQGCLVLAHRQAEKEFEDQLETARWEKEEAERARLDEMAD